MLGLSNSKTPSKGKRYLLTYYNVNYVTQRAPRDDNGNVTLMEQRENYKFVIDHILQL